MQPLPTGEINPETFLNVYKVYTTLTFKLADSCAEYYELLQSYQYPPFVSRGKIEQLETFFSNVPDIEFERCVIAMSFPGGWSVKAYIKDYRFYHKATVLIPTILKQIRAQVPRLAADNTSIQRMNFTYTGSNKNGNSIVL